MGEWGARTLSLPPPFRARGLQGASQMPEQGGMWAGGDECEPNAPCGLDEASAYFQEFFAQGREFGDGQRMSFGDIVTQIEHQPICGSVQNEPHLIGEKRTTGSSIRRQLGLVQFDQIFHLRTRAMKACRRYARPIRS